MEKRLFPNILLPLEEIALRRVVVNMWNSTLDLNWSDRYNLDLVEEKVKDQLIKMLPPLLKKRVIPLITPIGSEILNWQLYHEKNFHDMHEDFGSHYLKQLHWTCLGTIDYRKTAENLIDLKMFHVTKRYELACLYCLEDYIPLLWEEVSEDYKGLLNEEFYSSVDMQLKYYWAFIMKGEEHKFKSIFQTLLPEEFTFHQYAFKVSAVKGNKVATRYFFEKLSNAERKSSLLLTIYATLNERYKFSYHRKIYDFSMQNLSDVLCYLLLLLCPKQQLRALKNFPCPIFACFLDCPLNNLFLEVLDIMWTFLPEKTYCILLTYMHKIIRTSGYCSPQLFQEFLLGSPRDFRKKFVTKECQYGYFITEFFNRDDTETIEIIFRNIDAADRIRLMFSTRIFLLLCHAIYIGKWHLVEVCLREARLSKKDKKKLKMEFLKVMSKAQNGLAVEEKTRKRKRFCEFFDDTCSPSAGDGNLKDETLSEVKKFCTEKKFFQGTA